MLRPAALSLLALLLAIPLPAPAAENPKTVVRLTILHFVEALESADAPALRNLIWTLDTSEAHRQGRDAFIDLLVAQKKLERLTAARFPADAQRFRCNFDLALSPRQRQAISDGAIDALITIDESRTARLTLDNETWPIRLRRSRAGDWQVILDLIDIDLDDDPAAAVPQPDGLSQLRITRIRSLADATTQTAARVESGDLASPAAAETHLADRIATLNTDYRRQLDAILDRWRRYAR
jgi:hypothetical protein